MADNQDVRVLVVDDNSQIRALIVSILKSADFTKITEADDGKTAWDIIQKDKFDLISTGDNI